MDKSRICFVKTRKREGDYISDGIAKLGYKVIIPYKDTNLFRRLIREAWFRLHLPFRAIFFNKKLKKVDADIFIVADSLICKQFLIWLKKHHLDKRVVLNYENRADKTFNPDLVDSNVIEKYSYDQDDCKKYGMKYVHAVLVDAYNFDAREKIEDKYDIVFLGKDKNRLAKLHELQAKFSELGLRSYFYICADRSFLEFKNKEYKPLMPYVDYLELLKRSKAHLNIMPEGQRCLTQREVETAFYNIKCVTNNKGILDSELYDKSRYFVLGVDDFNNLKEFLDSPIKPVEKDIIKKYSFDSMVEAIVGE